MSRLTNKLKNEDGYCLVENDAVCELFATNKLGKLEDIEEALGCPTEVVFKALKNKYLYVLYANTKQRIKFLNSRLLYINNQWIIRANYAGFATNIIVKDYKKTWWLEGEKDE